MTFHGQGNRTIQSLRLQPSINIMLHSIIKRPLHLTAALSRRYLPSIPSSRYPYSLVFSNDSATNNSPVTRCSELTRVPSVVEGCDYEHWLVVMQAPKGCPLRDEIVNGYVKTLTMALGSEEEAKKSIYSVSTKYYYAFGCKVPENMTCKIKSLPNVKWVLPDSYLCHGENGYGGEPFIDGEVVLYDEKYHEDWVQDQNKDKGTSINHATKPRRKQKKNASYN